MAHHGATVSWTLHADDDFAAGAYSRAHTLAFDGGAVVAASSSPSVVPQWSDPAAVDPEELLIAAVSSCHMLSFLHLARLAGFIVRTYEDHAEGVLEEIAAGRQAITKVALRPKIDWAGPAPQKEALDRLHHQAHEICFIANSVKTQVTVE